MVRMDGVKFFQTHSQKKCYCQAIQQSFSWKLTACWKLPASLNFDNNRVLLKAKGFKGKMIAHCLVELGEINTCNLLYCFSIQN